MYVKVFLTHYRLVTDGWTELYSISIYTALALRSMVMESRLNTKHKENKRLRPTYGVCVAIVCVSDIDMCDGSRIGRPQYVGHCSNRPHHRPDTCKETGG